MSETCAGCQFFRSVSFSLGTCRRRSPVIATMRVTLDSRQPYEDELVGMWPAVAEDAWCGDFRARPPEGPEARHGTSA